MAEYLIQGETLTVIADAIRECSSWNGDWEGTSITPGDMPQAIIDVRQDGYDEGVQIGNAAGYEDGYNKGYRDGYDVGYDDGLSDGGGSSDESLITLVEQAQSSTFVRNPYNSNYYFPTEVYGAYGGSTFEDMAEIEYSSLSSNPLTISVGNYTSFYLSALITAHDKANQEQILGEMVVPPNGNNSIDFVSNALSPCDWEYTIDGVRYTKYEP